MHSKKKNRIPTPQTHIINRIGASQTRRKFEITFTADKSDGFSENTTRAVKQNSEHLNAEFNHDQKIYSFCSIDCQSVPFQLRLTFSTTFLLILQSCES